MAPRKKKNPVDIKVRVSVPELVRLDFTRHDNAIQADDDDFGLTFNLRLARISLYCIGTELELTLTNSIRMSCSVAYRADFTLEVAEGTPPEVYEAEMQRTAAYLAPATLYPFIREVVLTTIMRSGLTPFVLPIANFRQMFDPDQIVLPLVVESESEQHDPPEN